MCRAGTNLAGWLQPGDVAGMNGPPGAHEDHPESYFEGEHLFGRRRTDRPVLANCHQQCDQQAQVDRVDVRLKAQQSGGFGPPSLVTGSVVTVHGRV